MAVSVMPPPMSGDFQLIARSHAADSVFAQLAGAILRGDRAPGTTLPPERVLAEQFGASRVIVRQAVHRLAESGLVRVRQGGSTVILDPNDAADVRVVELYYRYGTRGDGEDLRQLTERQLLGAIGVVDVAARRATESDLSALAVIVEEWAASDDLEATFLEFEIRFWTTLARIGGNRVYAMETAWWFRLLRERPDLQHVRIAPARLRLGFIRELVRRLIARDEPTKFVFEITTSFLAALAKPSQHQPNVSAAHAPEERAIR